MKHISTRITKAVQKMKYEIEDSIKNSVSEFVILNIHDSVYSPIESYLKKMKKMTKVNDSEIDIGIKELKSLINNNALERELQNKMIQLLKFNKIELEVIKELVIVKNKKGKSKTGRIDVIVYAENTSKIIYELKRGSVNLISKHNPNDILKPLENAINQINVYGLSKVFYCREPLLENLSTFTKKLVIGRRMKISGNYVGIIEIENKDTSLKIYSWDAWISEFARIFN